MTRHHGPDLSAGGATWGGSASPPRDRPSALGAAGPWVLLGTALLQAASPALAGFDQGSDADPVIVPPGPFFAVWGVVVLGCLVVAVRGVGANRSANPVYTRLHVPLSLCQLGFVLWLVLASWAPIWTIPVFAVMIVCLAVALHRAPAGRAVDPVGPGDRLLVEAVLGVYAGWSVVAVWVNGATVLSVGDQGLQTALLVGAGVGALALLLLACRTPTAVVAAAAAATWALVGVLVSSAQAGVQPAAAVAGVAVLVVVLVGMARAVLLRRRAADTRRPA